MNAEKWQQVKALFNEVIELQKEERAVFLDVKCNGDKELRDELEKLLASDEHAETINAPFSILDADDVSDVENIGHYRIVREIGRGGMGAVYLATRDDFQKQVALKIIKRGMDSDEIKRRFLTERGILATLEHPNIARLLDGGTTNDDLPFFVMEYIEGDDLLTFCNARNLSVTERLKLFRKVCAAVSYAHTRLIVHRDLKPSNVIVTKDGEPKLLDFGISKILDSENPENIASIGTATNLGMMTPNYASPEQFRGETVTTSTDVYSLGVILYELLTNVLPYEVKNRRADEVAKIVLESIPTKPSAVLSATNQNITSKTAKSTAQTSKSLRLMKGDVDNIVLKALRKEPERRYSSVEQFSEDVRRHLAGLPVVARPDTFSYRAEKFILRNRASVVAAFLIALSLVGGIAATTWQTVRAERQRALAEKRFAEVRTLANNVVFKYYDAIENLQGATKARQMLITDAVEFFDGLSKDASDDAGLSIELARAYIRIGDLQSSTGKTNLGETANAFENFQKSMTIADNLAQKSPDDSEVLKLQILSHQSLADVLERMKGVSAARPHLLKNVELAKKLLSLAPNENFNLLKLADILIELSGSLPAGLEDGEGIAVALQSLPLVEQARAAKPHDEQVLSRVTTTQSRLSNAYMALAIDAEQSSDLQKSLEFYRKSLDYCRASQQAVEETIAIKPDSARYRHRLSTIRYNESIILRGLGETDEALKIQQGIMTEAIESAKDVDDIEAQYDLADIYQEIGATYSKRNDFVSASQHFDKSLAILDKIIANDAESLQARKSKFITTRNRADILQKQSDQNAAIKNYSAIVSELNADQSNAAFTAFAKGVIHTKIGDCYAKIAETNVSENRQMLESARNEYQKALEFWTQTPESSPVNFDQSTFALKYLNEKISNCDIKIAQSQVLSVWFLPQRTQSSQR